ncbi:MAG: hypothetical protein ACXWC9_00645, partial [Pseudobdellovibrionaceae bacterium]
MNQGFFKNATIVLVAGVLLASAYALKKIMQASPVQMDNQELSYEMPRARAETAGYSLAGRRVIRNIHSLPGKTDPMRPMNAAPVVNKADPKAAVQPVKKADVKKAAAKTAQKKKPKVSVAVTNWNRSAMTGFQVTRNNFRANENMGGFPPMPAAQNGSPLPDEEEEEDTSKISAAQWRSLLFSQPSAKNGMDFLTAFQKKDVEESSFYQI